MKLAPHLQVPKVESRPVMFFIGRTEIIDSLDLIMIFDRDTKLVRYSSLRNKRLPSRSIQTILLNGQFNYTLVIK